MVEVIWTDSAIEDLNDIGAYIAKDSVRYAEITIAELFGSVDILEEYPSYGIVVPEFDNEFVRQIIKGNYRIVYQIINDFKVEILTVHNCARLISKTKHF